MIKRLCNCFYKAVTKNWYKPDPLSLKGREIFMMERMTFLLRSEGLKVEEMDHLYGC